jgi:hypothetical protein
MSSVRLECVDDASGCDRSPLRVVAVLSSESSCWGGGGIDRPDAPPELLRDGKAGALDGKAGEPRPGSAGAALAGQQRAAVSESER